MAAAWTSYFNELNHFIVASRRHLGLADQNYSEFVIEKIESSCRTVNEIKAVLLNPGVVLDALEQAACDDYVIEIDQLIESLYIYLNKWRNHSEILRLNVYQVSLIHTGRRGRPTFFVQKEQIEYLLSLFFSWNEISQLLGISRMTLYRKRVELGMLNDATNDLSDEDLESVIEEFREENPYIGESLTMGMLRSRGFKIKRARMRTVLRKTGTFLRWPGGVIKRRVYHVAGPNSLWHIDSHHKLIRWRLVTHGGIDGFSRLIVYLKCATNITTQTVYSSFLEAIITYHLPSRVRSDLGRENVLVAQHMIERRGPDRQSMIVGSSVHNQRIERLWKDVHSCVTRLYYRLFYFLEDQGLLLPLNERHIFALHYVFVPRINRALGHFTHGWNHHPIRTAHSKSPHQLYNAGMLLLRHSGLSALDFFDDVDDTYGVDNDIPPDHDDEDIIVPRCSFTLTANQLQELRELVDPLSPSNNFGIDLYEQTLNYLS